MTNPKLPEFIRRDVERAIEDALHPKGMSTHDGKARIGVDRLQYLLRMIDGPQNADVLEFLRSFIAGGVNQDFKLWASELYQKLYRASDEPKAECQHDWSVYNLDNDQECLKCGATKPAPENRGGKHE